MADFHVWFRATFPDVMSFTADEILTKGSDTRGLNTDPPEALWPNVIPLVRALQAFRDRIGASVTINSCYRSPAYNASLPGAAKTSQHMQFKAADITVARGRPEDWAATLRAMRAEGIFVGGVGNYPGFVHIDVRGTVADWDFRPFDKRPVGVVLGRVRTGQTSAPPLVLRPTPLQPPEPPPGPTAGVFVGGTAIGSGAGAGAIASEAGASSGVAIVIGLLVVVAIAAPFVVRYLRKRRN